ncbi:FAD-dependent oxidoreductase [Granulicoccus phenolivorans]|uniref:FAD-dependent oxidoreductase n=1 Tax=Granulicoccus phenolivorans TaxID=266854 RepID=UPI001C3F2EB5
MDDVIVVGGGPTGLMLAGEVAARGGDVLVLERDPEPPQEVRALGLHVRSIEILDQRGLLERALAEGTTYPLTGIFAGESRARLPRTWIPRTATSSAFRSHGWNGCSMTMRAGAVRRCDGGAASSA